MVLLYNKFLYVQKNHQIKRCINISFQKIYDFYQKYKDKCFIQDLAIQNQLSRITNANIINEQYKARLAEGTTFTKDSVPTLIAWFDAGNGVVKDAGDNVSGWTDLSDGANHLDTTPATKPIWYDGIVNGKPAVFTNGNSYIRKTGVANFGTSLTFFMILKPTNIGTGDYQFFFSGYSAGSNICFQKPTGVTISRIQNGVNLNGEVFLSNRADIWTAIFNGATSSLRRNNNTALTGNAGTTASGNTISLFFMNSPAYYSFGYIAEFLLYDDSLSEANQEIVRQYLNNKYHIY